MFRKVYDFVADFREESEATGKLLAALTDASLAQRVSPEGRSLGQIAWHITLTLGEMLAHAQLAVAGTPADAPVPATVAELVAAYRRQAQAAVTAVAEAWNDAMLAEEIPMYGESWPRGKVLSALIRHEVHHRGQITVLARQAGVVIPGVYGPAREEWAALGISAPW
jgi:uncharacterized damage-inducible protein DinB